MTKSKCLLVPVRPEKNVVKSVFFAGFDHKANRTKLL